MSQATFSQSRNDMYWNIYDPQDGFIRWNGYNDDYWWNNIAPNEERQTRIGPKTGRAFLLDPVTGVVTIKDQTP